MLGGHIPHLPPKHMYHHFWARHASIQHRSSGKSAIAAPTQHAALCGTAFACCRCSNNSHDGALLQQSAARAFSFNSSCASKKIRLQPLLLCTIHNPCLVGDRDDVGRCAGAAVSLIARHPNHVGLTVRQCDHVHVASVPVVGHIADLLPLLQRGGLVQQRARSDAVVEPRRVAAVRQAPDHAAGAAEPRLFISNSCFQAGRLKQRQRTFRFFWGVNLPLPSLVYIAHIAHPFSNHHTYRHDHSNQRRGVWVDHHRHYRSIEIWYGMVYPNTELVRRFPFYMPPHLRN